MWLWVNSCPAVFVSLSMIYLCIYSPVCSLWFHLVYSLLPGVSCLCQPCPDVFIKDYYLSLILVCLFLISPCCVHRDRRPDHYKVSGAPSPRFVFRFSKVFCFVCVLSVLRQGSGHSSFRPSPRQVGVGVRRDRRKCRESAGREPSCLSIAGDILSSLCIIYYTFAYYCVCI